MTIVQALQDATEALTDAVDRYDGLTAAIQTQLTQFPANYLPRSGGTVAGVLSVADHGAEPDAFGTISVTTPANGLNYAAFSITRALEKVWSIGISAQNYLLFGVGGVKPNRTMLNHILALSETAIVPGVDGAISLGSGTNRVSVVYSVSGSINTSDENEKTALEPLTAAELRAARRILAGVGSYKWLSAVALKGDGARVHIGVTAQAVEAAFRAEGLDPARYALWCADPVLEEIEEEVEETRPVLVERTETRSEIAIEDGVPVLRSVQRTTSEPAYEMVQVVDAAGQPLTETVETEAGVVTRPRLHPVPRMQVVRETRRVRRPTGETRYGVRYDQLALFLLAALAGED